MPAFQERRPRCYSQSVIQPSRLKGFSALTLLLAVALAACHKEEQAVAGVAQNAVNAEQQAQAAAQSAAVDADTLNLRITMADANRSPIGKGTMLRPQAARRQQMQLRPADLAQALVALPPAAWRYGRVIAVAESPQASPKDRPKIRRNVEAIIQQLNDLGIVVDEWPTR
jgi:hypothetical protein